MAALWPWFSALRYAGGAFTEVHESSRPNLRMLPVATVHATNSRPIASVSMLLLLFLVPEPRCSLSSL